jgi:hypothetical protein
MPPSRTRSLRPFAGQFYNSLGFGLSVDEAFQQALFQVDLVHGKGHDIPQLLAADGVDAKTIVLVNPDAEAAVQ